MGLVVVFDFSSGGGFPNLIQIGEQVQVEKYVSIYPVEALDICILIRFPGLNNLHESSGVCICFYFKI